MLFNSDVFVFAFLPLTVAGFFLFGGMGRRRLAVAWLVLASAVFYGWFRWEYLPLLAVLIVFNYLYGIKLSRDFRRNRSSIGVLAFGVAVNLLVLGYFKYANFFIDNTNALLGTNLMLQHVVLPLGISFFTFQKIAYLVDAFHGQAEEYDFLEFCLFVMYFPQLIAGPIVHHKEMIPQFRAPAIFRPSAVDLAAGLTLFSIGLVKKIVIADNVVSWADPIFASAASGAPPSFLDAWGGALAFSFQIYFDFSGYTDMALGLALMIGIRLPLNFNSPYKAANIVDFWRRWHMTLSRFLRDYLYIPLGGNRHGSARRYANLMLTMLLGGLWHGAAWTFVAWGGLHGFYLMVNHGWRAVRRRRGAAVGSNASGHWTSQILTFVAVVVAWVFFRAENFHAAVVMLKGMVGRNGLVLPESYAPHFASLLYFLRRLGIQFDDARLANSGGMGEVVALAALLAAVWFLPNSQELLARLRPSLTSLEPARLRAPLRRVGGALGLVAADGSFSVSAVTGVIVASGFIGSLLYQSIRSTTLHTFIYFQF